MVVENNSANVQGAVEKCTYHDSVPGHQVQVPVPVQHAGLAVVAMTDSDGLTMVVLEVSAGRLAMMVVAEQVRVDVFEDLRAVGDVSLVILVAVIGRTVWEEVVLKMEMGMEVMGEGVIWWKEMTLK